MSASSEQTLLETRELLQQNLFSSALKYASAIETPELRESAFATIETAMVQWCQQYYPGVPRDAIARDWIPMEQLILLRDRGISPTIRDGIAALVAHERQIWEEVGEDGTFLENIYVFYKHPSLFADLGGISPALIRDWAEVAAGQIVEPRQAFSTLTDGNAALVDLAYQQRVLFVDEKWESLLLECARHRVPKQFAIGQFCQDLRRRCIYRGENYWSEEEGYDWDEVYYDNPAPSRERLEERDRALEALLSHLSPYLAGEDGSSSILFWSIAPGDYNENESHSVSLVVSFKCILLHQQFWTL